jgi:hypothetical protein
MDQAAAHAPGRRGAGWPVSLVKTSTNVLTACSTYRRPRTGGETCPVRGLTDSECNEKKSSGFIQSTGRYVDGQKRNCDERRVRVKPQSKRRARADFVARTVGGPLRSFPKEFNHPPAPRGQGRSKVVEPGYGVCGRSGFWEPRRTVFFHAAYCQPIRLLCTWPLCVGGGWLLIGVAGSLLGVGRYGESVPLLRHRRQVDPTACAALLPAPHHSISSSASPKRPVWPLSALD